MQEYLSGQENLTLLKARFGRIGNAVMFLKQTDFIRLNAVTLSIVSSLVLGCGSGKTVPSELKGLAKVSGSIRFKGEPTPGAYVVFHPVNPPQSRPIASGIVSPDGSFQIKSTIDQSIKPGVSPGDYRLTVSWPKPNPTTVDPEATQEQLPVKYLDPNTSGLLVSVESKGHQLAPFELNP